jgi:hypothetical protein
MVRGRMSALVLSVLILMIVAADGIAPVVPRASGVPRTSSVYGSAIAADSLANTQIGGTSCGCANLLTSFRFRADRSSPLAAIHIYLITDRSGYSGGSGGTINVTLQEDDRTSLHAPSGRVLAASTASLEAFPIVPFSDRPALVADALYHVVFRNVDPAPTENFVSVNSLYVTTAVTPRQPRYQDTDWAQLMNTGAGWVLRPQYTPILQLAYADGSVDGVGYVESWIEAAKTISGPERVREAFVVSGGDVRVSELAVRLGRLSGSAPLSIQLEDDAGGVILAANVPASSVVPVGSGDEPHQSWATVQLPTPLVLLDGGAYSLNLATAEDTAYLIHGIRKGSRVGFLAPTFFADGFAEADRGTGWVAFDPGWRGPLKEADLQFYLR